MPERVAIMNWAAMVGIAFVIAACGWVVGWAMCARHTDDREKRIADEVARHRKPIPNFARTPKPGDD